MRCARHAGWTGSRQYLRFMRQHAKDMGMFLSSHRWERWAAPLLHSARHAAGPPCLQAAAQLLIAGCAAGTSPPEAVPSPHAIGNRLLRKVGGDSLVVPEQAPPVDTAGQERWPLGWRPGRHVETEADLFELLGIPFREPHERNAP